MIYNLIDEVKQAMSGMLAPEYKQQIIGLAEVRDVQIACSALSPAVWLPKGPSSVTTQSSTPRQKGVCEEEKKPTLRRFKDDVNEVRNGMECGIGVKNYNDVRVGDMIEVFEIIEIQRTIA